VQTLILNDNKIRFIHGSSFPPSPKLETLWMNSNLIQDHKALVSNGPFIWYLKHSSILNWLNLANLNSIIRLLSSQLTLQRCLISIWCSTQTSLVQRRAAFIVTQLTGKKAIRVSRLFIIQIVKVFHLEPFVAIHSDLTQIQRVKRAVLSFPSYAI